MRSDDFRPARAFPHPLHRLGEAAGSRLALTRRSTMFVRSFQLIHAALLSMTLAAFSGCDSAAPPSAAAPNGATASTLRAGAGPQFVHGFEVGLRQAVSENRPMLVFFTAQWCHYCHEMADQVFTDPQIVQLSERFVCVVVDADAETAVCDQFDVRAFPTLQFFSPQGVPLKRLVGKKEAAMLAYEMRSTLQAIALRDKSSPTVTR